MANVKLGELAKALRDSVTTVRGTTSPEVRRKIFERAACKVKGTTGPDIPELAAVVDAVAVQPHRADLKALLERGLSEDAVYEVVVTASVGAGYARVEQALAVLEAVKG